MRQSHRVSTLATLKTERDRAMTCAVLNAETIHEQRRESQQIISMLSADLGAAWKLLRQLKDVLETHVIEVRPDYTGTGVTRTSFATLGMVIEDSDKFCAFVRSCSADCRNLQPHQHEGRRS